ncbi:chemotaxis protein CheW [Caldithrix abyssi]|nr:chemotaxis protein CheW [Caldithrix abyssi]
MIMTANYLVFKLGKNEYAIQLGYVKKVSQIVEISPIPKGPKNLIGLINVHGEITPVINLRYILGLKEREINLNDQLIIIESNKSGLAFVVDQVSQIVPAYDENSIPVQNIVPDAKFFERVIKEEEGFIYCINPDTLLTKSELQKINRKVKEEYEKIERQIIAS